MTTPEMKPLLPNCPKCGQGESYKITTAGIPLCTICGFRLDSVPSIDGAPSRPTPQPSSEYGEAIALIENADAEIMRFVSQQPEGDFENGPNSPIAFAAGYIREALATLKSNPAPAKEPKDGLKAAVRAARGHEFPAARPGYNPGGNSPCTKCGGEGTRELNEEPCQHCKGSGFEPAKEPSGELEKAASVIAGLEDGLSEAQRAITSMTKILKELEKRFDIEEDGGAWSMNIKMGRFARSVGEVARAFIKRRG